MATTIEDGSGKGFSTKVDETNRLSVRGITESEFDKALTVEDADKQQSLLIEISDKQNVNEQLIELLPSKAAKLERAIHMLRDYCYLEVQKSLHSNVELRIFNKVLKTARSYPPLTARIDKNKIELEFKTT